MIIIKLLSHIFGYRFFSYLNSMYSHLISHSVNRKLRKTDGFSRFQYPSVIKGLEYIEIGKSFQAGSRLRLQAIDHYRNGQFSPKIIIGDNVIINPNCQIVAINKIEIGSNVLMASNVFISDHAHGRSDFGDVTLAPEKRELSSKGPVIIGDNVWIGQNVSILANVIIGDNVIIGANSVVTKSIVANSIVAGAPATVLKTI
ncbi:DapH/DapD/GlmU-related protein [Sphingobacterium sp. GVS05A]|uniref:DapH/DapD/GlmU-related protein n=1 Tax=Sphingobacterium sp. GVS05A TaxID=2862679 RepID=UPI001CBD0368|nr:DapH/DapD/GlmU-related protein [Sphingobacterium sp. GVS05A]